MPGGSVMMIPGHIEQAIKRMVPNADWALIRFIAEQYQMERDHLPDRQSPAETRKSLDAVIEKAVWLRCDLLMLPEESLNALDDFAAIDAAIGSLSRLIGTGKRGHNEVEPKDGAPPSLRKQFIRSLAGVLGKAGYEANGTPNGHLVAVTSELLSFYSDKPADVPAMVRGAMRENPQKAS